MNDNFFQRMDTNFNIQLNNSQKKAVSHKNGPALVLAIPGSGKTTTLISRVASLCLVDGVDPKSILSITFSKASAVDMSVRFKSIFGNSLKSNPSFSTIHSFSYNVLKNYSRFKKTSFHLLENSNDFSKHRILKDIFKDINSYHISDDKLDDLINDIGFINNMMISPENFNSNGIKNFKDIYYRYKDFKKENNLIDFDDMLNICLHILQENKDILKAYKTKYKYIQLDEGQDTSNIQFKIIELLSSENNNIFIVADDDQSIYGFRGANPSYLLSFKTKYPDVKIIKMNINYRSTPEIVSVSNSIIKKNTMRYNKEPISNNSISNPINILHLKDLNSQYDYIIKNLNLNKLNDTAILFRNNISTVALVELLESNNIPFRLKESNLKFFNHWILKDIRAFLNLSLNQKSLVDFKQIYYKMKGYFSKKNIAFLESSGLIKLSVFETLKSFSDLEDFQKRTIQNISTNFNELSTLSPKEAIEFIKNNLNYIDYLQERSSFTGNSIDSYFIYLSHIESIASNYNNIFDFLDRLEELKQIVTNRHNDGVLLSTIHSAKGLEFNDVFITDLINGEFPNNSSLTNMKQGSLDDVEEERRLFYVAITRAKENLYILTYDNRNSKKIKSSLFFNEIKSILDENIEADISIGSEIFHQKFDKGIVLDVDDTSILVDFENHGIKQLLKSICIKNSIIKV